MTTAPGASRQPGWLIALGIVAGARVLGLFSLGLVTSASMAPVLPAGSVVLALPAEPGPGDIVVFEAPDGARVVHRVVGTTAEGLVTRGDANAHTDQEAGVPPVDPGDAHVVPSIGGRPVAITGPWVKPAALAAAQVVLLTIGLRGLFSEAARRRRTIRLRPHHMLVGAALVMLLAAPLFHERTDAPGTIAVSATALPTMARVTTVGGVEHVVVPAMGTAVVEATGPVEIVRAPALPGAALLSKWGATAAVLPAVAVAAAAAWAVRAGGW